MQPEPLHNPTCFANHMGLWSIEPGFLSRALSAIKAGTWQPRPRAAEPPAGAPAIPRGWTLDSNGVAVIQIRGSMMKGLSKYAEVDTVAVRRALREAASDERAKAILLVIDSPGGSVPGTYELALDVAAADKKKPTYAYLEDLGASAAYWVASQARRISVNQAGEVGSIGVYAVVEDTSKMAEKEGVSVHVVATGPYKGAFTPGSPVLPEHLAYLQERVNANAVLFFDAVRDGRGLSEEKLAAATDGRVFGAAEAKKLGLVDAVEPYEGAYDVVLEDIETAAARARAARVRARAAERA